MPTALPDVTRQSSGSRFSPEKPCGRFDATSCLGSLDADASSDVSADDMCPDSRPDFADFELDGAEGVRGDASAEWDSFGETFQANAPSGAHHVAVLQTVTVPQPVTTGPPVAMTCTSALIALVTSEPGGVGALAMDGDNVVAFAKSGAGFNDQGSEFVAESTNASNGTGSATRASAFDRVALVDDLTSSRSFLIPTEEWLETPEPSMIMGAGASTRTGDIMLADGNRDLVSSAPALGPAALRAPEIAAHKGRGVAHQALHSLTGLDCATSRQEAIVDAHITAVPLDSANDEAATPLEPSLKPPNIEDDFEDVCSGLCPCHRSLSPAVCVTAICALIALCTNLHASVDRR